MAMKIRKALENLRKANTRLMVAIEDELPPGTKCRYSRGHCWIKCTVVTTGTRRIRVRNDKTGKEVWVHIYRIAV